MKIFVSLSLACMMLQGTLMGQNVGIGTSSPSFPLDLVGRMRIQASTLNNAGTSSGIWHTDFRNNANIVFAGMADSVNYGLYSQRAGIEWQYFFDARYGNIGIGRKPASGSSRLTIDHASGASIGLYSNTSYRGAVGANDSMVFLNGWRSVSLQTSGGNVIIQQPGGCTQSGQFFFCSYPGNTGFYVNDPKARIHMAASTGASGVLIGGTTSTPAVGYMLSVDGKVICEEVRVQLSGSWPDYVFEPDYPLTPIGQLEQQVMRQKHLPGIPSAAQVEAQKGVDMGSTQKQLLEKIEELYRYMFEMNKRVSELETENQQLKLAKNIK